VSENVRLIIWDLDETFWRGTVTEGGIEQIIRNHEIVIELAKRGIVSTICSKNDAETINRILEENRIDNYFIFPSINWESKGPRVAQLIEAIGLRPPTVMFIDDNPMNLNEVKHFVPDIQVADPSILECLLEHPLFQGKFDPELTRLNQYKLLQKRHEDESAAKSSGTSNYDFLRSSNIRVRIEFDIKSHIDRAIELINRTNQLNFTKKRLPEDSLQAHTELLEYIARYDIQAGLVHVQDDYGDYGFVGFYAARTVQNRSDLEHFCFSCRTLGMGIETWVWRNIGRPWFPTVGDVLSDPRDETLPADWITLVSEGDETAAGGTPDQPKSIERLVLRGGCGGLSLAHYFHAVTTEVIAEVATARYGVPIRLEHTLFLANGLSDLSPESLREAEKLGYQPSDFKTCIFDQIGSKVIAVFDFWTDSEIAVYRHKESGLRLPFVAPYHFPLKPEENATLLPADFFAPGYGSDHPIHQAISHLRDNYEFEGLISESLFKSNLNRILENIPKNIDIFILSANETWLNPANRIVYEYAHHASLNEWTREVVSKYSNTTFINIKDFIENESDAETVNHFDRLVYYRIFKEIKGWVKKSVNSVAEVGLV
jgi:FkbH-like protein